VTDSKRVHALALQSIWFTHVYIHILYGPSFCAWVRFDISDVWYL